MSNRKTNAGTQGFGCIGVVGIIFVVLKLLSIEPVASRSWIWVLCPFWISLAIPLVILILVIPLAMVLMKIFG